MDEKYNQDVETHQADSSSEDLREVFGDDKHHQIKYRTLSWPFVATIMITEIVTGLTADVLFLKDHHVLT